ncbi:hypothetical protein C0989_003422 [Termitomyces sp. Mn162]|nr:hypothetical protein C0989_003422 [Termitomyces sp. Mn162]
MNQTATQPTFTLITDDTTTSMNNETFVIALVDPDVPSPSGTGRTEFFHFLGANFSMDPSSSNLVNSTPAVLEWFPLTPPPGDPPHRYTLVVYEQPDSFSDVVPTLVNASTNRLSFNFSSFTVAANLASPIAGNYFLVGADNSTAASATPSATPTATNQPTLTALPLSTSGISSILTISTSTVTAPPTTSPISAAGYPKPMMGGISFTKLPPGANRILFVKNLNYQITGEDLYDLFGRYGTIRQIRIGNEQKTRGTAFVVFDDVMDVRCRRVEAWVSPKPLQSQAKNALEHLNGFHLQERYIVVLYHMPAKQDAAAAKADLARREEELAALKKKHNIGDD